MEVGKIIKLRWAMNHNIYIGVVHRINNHFLSFCEPCIIINVLGNIVPLHGVIMVNSIFYKEEKVKENDLFLLWKEIGKSYSENRESFEELVFKEIEKIKRSR